MPRRKTTPPVNPTPAPPPLGVHPIEPPPDPPCATIPCWLCRRPVHVRRSKDGHHFVSCMDCGMQTFIRSSAGEQHLLELCKQGKCG